ncbi:unnamed protein product [Aphanomyces euteiches]
MDIAAKHGHLDVVVFLHENRQEGCTEKAIEGAAEAGHLQVVQYLHAHRFEATTHRAMDYAARNGHFDAAAQLRWISLPHTVIWPLSSFFTPIERKGAARTLWTVPQEMVTSTWFGFCLSVALKVVREKRIFTRRYTIPQQI